MENLAAYLLKSQPDLEISKIQNLVSKVTVALISDITKYVPEKELKKLVQAQKEELFK